MIKGIIVNVLQWAGDGDACIGHKAREKLFAKFGFDFCRSRFDGFSIKRIEKHALEPIWEIVFQSLLVSSFTHAAENEVALRN